MEMASGKVAAEIRPTRSDAQPDLNLGCSDSNPFLSRPLNIGYYFDDDVAQGRDGDDWHKIVSNATLEFFCKVILILK